jgi:hypothetical protein
MNKRTMKNSSVVNFLGNHSGIDTSINRDKSFVFTLPPFVDAQIIKCIAQGKVTRKGEVK